MKIKRIVVICFFVLVIITAFIIKGVGNKDTMAFACLERVADIEIPTKGWIKIGGLVAWWVYIDREIDLDYFYELDGTTTYDQIVEEIGVPNGTLGFGLVLPYYQVDDLYVVISFSVDENGECDKVGMVELYSNDALIEKIYPR